MAIHAAKTSNVSNRPMQLNFTKYPKQTMKVKFNITLFCAHCKFSDISDGGHYDHDKFPWHAQMIDQKCKTLERLIGSLSLDKSIDLIIGLARIPVEPCTGLINIILERITIESFFDRALQLFCPEYCETLAQIGTIFLTEDDTTVLMLCHYLHRSKVPVTGDNLQKELLKISKTIVGDAENSDLAKDTDGMTGWSVTGLFKMKKQTTIQYLPDVDVKGGKFKLYYVHTDLDGTGLAFPKVGLTMTIDNPTKNIDAEFSLLVKHGGKKIYYDLHQFTFTPDYSRFFVPMENLPKLPDGEELEITPIFTKWIDSQK